MSLDPRRVLILREVVAAGSISAGARALGWTQPAVTQHIRALERAVGTPLILRRATGVTPTEAGRALLAHADAISSHLDAAESELSELRQCHAGTVRLAAFPSSLATLVPLAMKEMAVSGGAGLSVRLVEAEPDAAIRMLRDDEVDLAIIFSYPDVARPELDDGLQRRMIATDPVVLILPPTHPLAGQKSLSLADLADEDWVAGCSRCREHLVVTARRAGFEPRISYETDDYVVVQSLVGQGLAVSVLPRVALAAYQSPAVAVRDAPEMTGRRIETLLRPGADRVPSTATMLRALSATNPRPDLGD